MSLFAPLQGENPSAAQLIATYGLAVLAAGLVIWFAGSGWAALLCALFAADWVGGIVANSAESTRAWWRQRTQLHSAFYAVHALEAVIVLLLPASGALKAVLLMALAAKLAVFRLGRA